ncbi:MAG: glycosyltransferase [Synechococcaceae cyanobacterium]|nr:glycosyltransferase [Synechococcaceae cyanobacterium]
MNPPPPPPQPPTLSLVMPTIAWDATFERCARAALAGLRPGEQALIMFDGTPPQPPAWLLDAGARLLSTGRRQGPAAARNLAAAEASGALLLFVDADVELHHDAIERIRAQFKADPDLTALFGSYDDRPAAPGLVSRFRNLLHHHTHSTHPGPATTFWAGIGAVRREAFLGVGGFDAATYPHPSIEDIELGLRLSDGGGRILLDPSIQGTHHKRWTLASMVSTDIRRRALPWSRLLLRRRQGSTSLNLDGDARLSSLLWLLALLGAAAWPFVPGIWPVPLLALALLLLLNRRFYGLCRRRGGILLALAAVGLHGLYFLYSLVSYSCVWCSALVERRPPAG